MKIRKVLLIILGVIALGVALSFVFGSRGPSHLQLLEYVLEVRESENLRSEKTVSEYKYTCTLMPSEFCAVQNLRPGLEKSDYNSALKKTEGFVYFKLSIQAVSSYESVLESNKLDPNLYNQRIYYFNAFAQKNLKGLIGSDTIQCTQYLFENPYNLGKELNILCGFKCQDIRRQDIQFIYNDELFNNGLVKFYYSKSDLEKVPILVI